MEQVLRIGLPIYYVAFFGIAFFWRSYLVWKRTGINPYVFGKTDSAYDYIGVGYRFSLALGFVAIVVFSFLPGYYQYLAPLTWLETVPTQGIGLGLLIAALAFVAVAQGQMGRSWRVGIDLENKTELVNNGLFKISRNPIFLGMRVSGLGFFLAIPNALTFATLVMGEVLMQVQVRLEEEFLLDLHGEKYKEFKKKVRRWI